MDSVIGSARYGAGGKSRPVAWWRRVGALRMADPLVLLSWGACCGTLADWSCPGEAIPNLKGNRPAVNRANKEAPAC
jgi:hypothetical protein